MFFYIISYTIWFMIEFLVNTAGRGTTVSRFVLDSQISDVTVHLTFYISQVTAINGVTDLLYTLDAVFVLAVFRSPSRKFHKLRFVRMACRQYTFNQLLL